MFIIVKALTLTTSIRAFGSMADERKIRVEKFNGVNFRFCKMQIEDYLCQKDLYLSLGENTHKPKEMSDGKWDILDRKAL